MRLKRERVECKNGDTAELFLLKAPLEEYLERVLSLTSESMPWARDNLKRAAGETEQECDNYYFYAEMRGVPASLMWYTEKCGVATYGLVYTKEEFRGLGLVNLLMRRCCGHMAQNGVKSAYLAVSNQVAMAIYQGFEFAVINGNEQCSIMRRDFSETADYFTYDREALIRRVRRSDLPLLEALYNVRDSRVKDENMLIYQDTAVECQLIEMINRAEAGEGSFYCLQTHKGSIVGGATRLGDKISCYVYPLFEKWREPLTDAVRNSEGKENESGTDRQ